jgi:hypothetical protein
MHDYPVLYLSGSRLLGREVGTCSQATREVSTSVLRAPVPDRRKQPPKPLRASSAVVKRCRVRTDVTT